MTSLRGATISTVRLRTPIWMLTVAVSLLGWASPARADDPAPPALSPGLPRLMPISLGLGDSIGSGGALDARVVEPLRLALLGVNGITPTSQCGDQFADTRSGRSPLLQMGAFGTNLLGGTSWRSPRLSLFGFSRVGCTYDGAVGGGFALTVPITRKVSLVLSGGAIYLPTPQPGTIRPGVQGAGRIDLVFQGSGGRSFNVGIGNRGMSFGGVW